MSLAGPAEVGEWHQPSMLVEPTHLCILVQGIQMLGVILEQVKLWAAIGPGRKGRCVFTPKGWQGLFQCPESW